MGRYAESRSRFLYVETPAPSPIAISTRGLVAQWQLLHWRFLMLRWALGLLLAALVTGFFAFVGIGSPVEALARVLFFALLTGFFVALFVGLIGGRKTGV